MQFFDSHTALVYTVDSVSVANDYSLLLSLFNCKSWVRFVIVTNFSDENLLHFLPHPKTKERIEK